MITILAAQIFLEAFLLRLILLLVARHEADHSFAKVAMVTAGITLGGFLIEVLTTEHLGAFTLIPVLAFVAFMLMTFCWVRFGKSILVVILFSGFHILLSIGATTISQRVSKSVSKSVAAQLPVKEEDYKMAKEFMDQVFGQAEPAPPSDAQPQSPQPGSPSVTAPRHPPMVRPTSRQSAPSTTTAAPEVDERDRDSGAWAEARKRIEFGGVMTLEDGTHVTLANGEAVREGETVSARYDGNVYMWRIRSIAKGKVDLTPLKVLPTPK